jgi:hypothetical protein
MNEKNLHALLRMSDFEINEIVKIKTLLELNNQLETIRKIAVLM